MSNSGKILQRFFKNAKYSQDDWDLLEKSLQENEPWKIVCSHFNISHHYYKIINKHFKETGSIY